MCAAESAYTTQMQPCTYITGFGPFPGVPNNPTEAIVDALRGHSLGGNKIHAEVLPVSFARATAQVQASLVRLKPQAAVHFGVAERSTLLRLEVQAANLMSAQQPDVDDIVHQVQRIDTDKAAEATRVTAMPLHDLAGQLQAGGFATQVSTDAGRYVCNRVYYASLALAACPSFFVHVPPIGATPGDGSPQWTHERLTTAAHRILEWAAVVTSEASNSCP